MTHIQSGHWTEISQNWSHVGPPLRPSQEDIATFQAIVRSNAPIAPLLMGVTPELYRLNWPSQSSVVAVDHTIRMIETVWNGDSDRVVLGDWRSLPLRNASRDMAVCDGGFHLNDYPDGQHKVAESLRRILSSGGVFAVRLFDPPVQKEEPKSVLKDLMAGSIPNLNVLKIRLGMALQQSPSKGVRLDDVWQEVSSLAPSLGGLANRLSWPVEHLRAIESYRESEAKYCFVSISEVTQIFCKDVGGFELSHLSYPSYELGERFPIAVFRRL